jgi:hypothetical protein
MNEIFEKACEFILTNARLLERRLFQVHFKGESPDCIGQVIRAYQNPDGGLGHALEPDVRCSESQPLFVGVGLTALQEAGCRDEELASDLCHYLDSVSDEGGLVPILHESGYRSPRADHWNGSSTFASGLNPTAEICGLLHYQGVRHEWLSQATNTCCKMILNNPPLEAHILFSAGRLAEFIPDRTMAGNLLDTIASVLLKANYFIPDAPVDRYGLTPLHFAPRPDSIFRQIFTQAQIDGHLEDLKGQQQEDGGWPITWKAPGPASVCEWRGRWTLDAICRLVNYGVISNE